MKEIEYTLEVKTENNCIRTHAFTEYDEEKWDKIAKMCDERKANITSLLESYLDGLTPEKAEEILMSWDM